MGKASDRALICLPTGGLNDSLVAIGKCFELCFIQHEYQELIICDDYSDGLMGQLGQVLEIQEQTERDSRFRLKRFARIRPRISCKKINLYDHQSIATTINSTKSISSARSNFPITTIPKTMDEWALTNNIKPETPNTLNSRYSLFIGYGGGPPSKAFLRALKLRKSYAIIAGKILRELPPKYDAAHVRNTDMKTNYIKLFKSISSQSKTSNKLIICSDDPTMEKHAYDFFGANRLYIKSKLIEKVIPFSAKVNLNQNGKLHNPNLYQSIKDKKTFLLRTIVDLFCLANSSNLFFSNVEESYSSKTCEAATSGYSLLADILKKDPSLMNRKDVMALCREV